MGTIGAIGTINPHYSLGSGVATHVDWQTWTLAGLLFGVLTAIIVSMAIVLHGANAEPTWRNPQLVGALAACGVFAFTRRPPAHDRYRLAVLFVWQVVSAR
jgi:hypothetical protein